MLNRFSGRLPEDKSLLYDCMKNSQACFLLLYLKNFLMKLYGFSEAYVSYLSGVSKYYIFLQSEFFVVFLKKKFLVFILQKSARI